MGDEAAAWGAIDAGISAAYAYPGTPSTEAFETVLDQLEAGRLERRAQLANGTKHRITRRSGA